MNNFESRVLQVVEPYLDEIRTLFDDVPSGDTSGMQECCAKVLAAINDTNREVRNLSRTVTRSGSKPKGNDDDSEDDTRDPIDTAKQLVQWLFSPAISDDDRRFIVDQLFDVGDDDEGIVPVTPQAALERVQQIASIALPVGNTAMNVIKSLQLHGIATHLDRLSKQMAGNSNRLTNVMNIRSGEMMRQLESVQNAFEECCSGMQDKFNKLRDDVIVSQSNVNGRLP